jgi:hypothetical protein
MTTQNYLMIDTFTNVVYNVCYWDGGPEWTPPADTLMLIQATTPAMVWEPVIETDPVTQKPIIVDYVLVEQLGAGNIEFTWNGSVVTTNQPKPSIPND